MIVPSTPPRGAGDAPPLPPTEALVADPGGAQWTCEAPQNRQAPPGCRMASAAARAMSAVRGLAWCVCAVAAALRIAARTDSLGPPAAAGRTEPAPGAVASAGRPARPIGGDCSACRAALAVLAPWRRSGPPRRIIRTISATLSSRARDSPPPPCDACAAPDCLAAFIRERKTDSSEPNTPAALAAACVGARDSPRPVASLAPV